MGAQFLAAISVILFVCAWVLYLTWQTTVFVLLLALSGYLAMRALYARLIDVGLISFLSDDTQDFLLNRSLLDWLTDTYFTDQITALITLTYFSDSLSSREHRRVMAKLSPTWRAFFLRKGLIHIFPQSLHSILLSPAQKHILKTNPVRTPITATLRSCIPRNNRSSSLPLLSSLGNVPLVASIEDITSVTDTDSPLLKSEVSNSVNKKDNDGAGNDYDNIGDSNDRNSCDDEATTDVGSSIVWGGQRLQAQTYSYEASDDVGTKRILYFNPIEIHSPTSSATSSTNPTEINSQSPPTTSVTSTTANSGKGVLPIPPSYDSGENSPVSDEDWVHSSNSNSGVHSTDNGAALENNTPNNANVSAQNNMQSPIQSNQRNLVLSSPDSLDNEGVGALLIRKANEKVKRSLFDAAATIPFLRLFLNGTTTGVDNIGNTSIPTSALPNMFMPTTSTLPIHSQVTPSSTKSNILLYGTAISSVMLLSQLYTSKRVRHWALQTGQLAIFVGALGTVSAYIFSHYIDTIIPQSTRDNFNTAHYIISTGLCLIHDSSFFAFYSWHFMNTIGLQQLQSQMDPQARQRILHTDNSPRVSAGSKFNTGIDSISTGGNHHSIFDNHRRRHLSHTSPVPNTASIPNSSSVSSTPISLWTDIDRSVSTNSNTTLAKLLSFVKRCFKHPLTWVVIAAIIYRRRTFQRLLMDNDSKKSSENVKKMVANFQLLNGDFRNAQ